MSKWLTIVGIGEDGMDGLSAAASAAIAAAQTLVGGKRHLGLVGATHAERIEWSSPLDATFDLIAARRGTRVVVLASGDPMWFGIGTTLLKRFSIDEMAVLPNVSAFALAASEMGWPLDAVEKLSLHGRPLEALALHLAPCAKLLALTSDGAAPAAIAAFLSERGYGGSAVSVLEHLGGSKMRRVSGIAASLPAGPYADLNTLAIECVADADTLALSRVPGLPDAAFEHDGQLTKRAVRAATLAALAPLPGQLLWDIGAGNGSVAIEWLRAVPSANAIAVERDAARHARLLHNAKTLGVPQLQAVAGSAPAAFAGLPAPDAVFVGGGLSTQGLVEAAWAALKQGGVFVANAVTLEGEGVLAELHRDKGGEMMRLAVAHAEPVGPHRGWRAAMPVTQWIGRKT
ncbi:MAG: precorrin-6y C5,15-methyltransferase (decarboxylating) subunit CbiE [Telmatospirillum sp.]|nr:precorrin-6y C5,15-methyltransferase (decarboxylating) subunit CbiE [Telmatospirillum sp.]